MKPSSCWPRPQQRRGREGLAHVLFRLQRASSADFGVPASPITADHGSGLVVRFHRGSPAFAHECTQRLPAEAPKGVGELPPRPNETPAGKPAAEHEAAVETAIQSPRRVTRTIDGVPIALRKARRPSPQHGKSDDLEMPWASP